MVNNRFSNYGDLHPWGGSTLLEWKISQANKVKEIKDIYVATPNNSIKKECKRLGIKTFSRNKNESLSEFHFKISNSFKDNYLLFLNPTSPFLSTKIIVKGRENIITDKKFFIASSHQSMFETFYLQTIFNSPRFILKDELLRIPIFGWYLKKIGSISINRNKITKDKEGKYENML